MDYRHYFLYYRRIMKIIIAALLLLVTFTVSAHSQSASFVITNATVIDGTGKPRYMADVRVKGDRIVKIGKITPAKGETTIDGSGLVLAPGFIDIHNHSESGLLEEGTAANQVSQGLTTIMVGPDGDSPWPISDYFAKIQGKIAPNVGAFIGHGTVRVEVMKDDYQRTATPQEIAAMGKLVERAMNEGAFGLSSGLEYDAGYMATTEELVELSKVAARYGGIYMTHMRDEEEGVMDAIREAVRIGKEAKIPVQISHIKMGNSSVWNKAPEAVAIIETARKAGQDVTADAYPYTAWASTITVLVPSRKHEDRDEVLKGITAIGGPDKVLITSCQAIPAYEGKTLAQAAEIAGTDAVSVYIDIVKKGGAGVIGYGMTESDVKTFYQTPWIMVSSDGGIGSKHPRGTGTFPRVLGWFARENKWISLEDAVHKMSGLTAARLGLKDRGIIRKGMKADLVLFDPNTVIDRATFTQPQTFAAGIRSVFVNGVKVWDGEKVTHATPGMILKRR